MSQQPTNPLFHDKTLTTAIRAFTFPADLSERHGKVLQWIDALRSGTLDGIKETSLHGSFLADFFQAILGYRSVMQGSGQAWEIHAEQSISDGGGSADLVNQVYGLTPEEIDLIWKTALLKMSIPRPI